MEMRARSTMECPAFHVPLFASIMYRTFGRVFFLNSELASGAEGSSGGRPGLWAASIETINTRPADDQFSFLSPSLIIVWEVECIYEGDNTDRLCLDIGVQNFSCFPTTLAAPQTSRHGVHYCVCMATPRQRPQAACCQCGQKKTLLPHCQ